MARNRKRANRRPTGQRPPGPGPGAGGPLSGANGRGDVEAQEPQDVELEPGAVEADAPEPAAAEESDSGLQPIDFAATNIEPLDLGLDTGLTPEVDIAAGAERAAAENQGYSEGEPVAEGDEDSEEEPPDEEVEAFLEEHPEDAADTALYEDPDDVQADADTDYDEDGEPDDDDGGSALATVPSRRRPRPAREPREAAAHTGTAVAVPHTSTPMRLIHFLQGSWRELQRVQWPDRRQVMQATGVVVGFVIVAGAYLGVADYLATKLMNFILG